MIERKIYFEKIKPFIDKDIIKVLTGIRRSGKSVMLKLIMKELKKNGIDENQFIYINFENLRNRHLCYAYIEWIYIGKSREYSRKMLFIFGWNSGSKRIGKVYKFIKNRR